MRRWILWAVGMMSGFWPAGLAGAGEMPAARMNLLVAGLVEGSYRAALVLDLPPGWHSYWRTPGDAGMPPRFTFAPQDISARIAFPLPRRRDDAGTITLVYEGRVVLPLTLTPRDINRPMALKVHLDLGLCKDICVPASAEASARLAPDLAPDPAAAAEIAAAEKRVPLPESAAGGLVLAPLRLGQDANGKPALLIDVTGKDIRDLFSEPPAPWGLPQPELLDRQEDTTHYRLSLAGLPRSVSPGGQLIRLTVATDGGGVEFMRVFP